MGTKALILLGRGGGDWTKRGFLNKFKTLLKKKKLQVKSS